LPLAATLLALACSSESGTQPDDLNGQGGQVGAGGAQTTFGGNGNGTGGGANANGGASSGGASSGGASNGGASSGGAPMGGATSGGATGQGGSNATGGANRGGASAGGTTGANTGGKSSNSGGNPARGGASNGGTTGAGGNQARGGASNGGSASGGKTGAGGAGVGGSGMGGSGMGGAVGGGGSSSGKAFSQCRFHFGTIDSKAKNGGSALISQLDFFTPGWMMNEAFDQQYVCDEGKAGAVLGNQVPVIVTYIAANYVKKHNGLCDCNVTTCGANNDLCHHGAQLISQNLTAIVNAYKSYSQGYANCYGTTRPIIFEMEPDWYQYTISSQTQRWSATQAADILSQLVAALKTSLPNARFSIDASPWVSDSSGGGNGADNGAWWYSNFNMSLFTFVNTSGGGTNANTAKIRSSNSMTWAGLSQVTGKPVLADTGYGANGVSAGHDANWDSAANINARINDGVISIAQYNPNSNWGTTISGVRSQLSAPKFCP
jgi:hypothetical protein